MRKDEAFDRLVAIHEASRERFDRAVSALRTAGVGFAICGENATGIWIERVDEGAIRGTPLIEFLVQRADCPVIETALQRADFRPHPSHEQIHFIDVRTHSKLSSVVLHCAHEKDFADQLAENPGVDESELVNGLFVLSLDPLVRMLLARYRTIDRVMIADLAGVGLVDRSWMERYDETFAARLCSVLDQFDEDRRWHPISSLPIPSEPRDTVR